ERVDRVAGEEVDQQHEETRVGAGPLGDVTEVHLWIQILAGGQHPQTVSALGTELVSVVVGGVLLGPTQGAAHAGHDVGHGDAELPPARGVSGGDVPDFVPDHNT